jgi:hypothetical protein
MPRPAERSATLALVLGASSACTTIDTTRGSGEVWIRTEPRDAEIWQVDGADQHQVGVGRATVRSDYQTETLSASAACFALGHIGLFGALGLGALLDSTWPLRQPVAYTAIVGYAGVLAYCIASAVESGTEMSPEPRTSFVVTRAGYAPKVVDVDLSHRRTSELRIRLDPLLTSSVSPSASRRPPRISLSALADPSAVLSPRSRAKLTAEFAGALAQTTRFTVVLPLEPTDASIVLRLVRVDRRCTLTAGLLDLKTETIWSAASLAAKCDERSLVELLPALAGELAADEVGRL